MNIVLSFSALCILLVVGKLLRVEIRLFQKLYLPASVIGGLLGLVLVQTIGDSLPAATMAGWNQLPGFLINIVFSALFLGVFIPPIRRIWGIAGPQLAYGQIVAWGQYVVGLGVAIVLLTPVFGVPGAIGTIIPVGFEEGTARPLAWNRSSMPMPGPRAGIWPSPRRPAVSYSRSSSGWRSSTGRRAGATPGS